jgi:hypothetical protein
MPAYMIGTLAGLAPRTLAVVITFANLEQLDFAHPLQNWMRVGGIVLTLLVVYVIGRMAQNAARGITGAEGRGGFA